MPGAKRDENIDLGRTTYAYGLALGRAMKAAGLAVEELVGDGLSKSHIHRLITPKTTEVRPPVERAEQLRRKIEKRAGKLDLPPPIIPTVNVQHFEWADLGAKLQASDERQFLELLENLRKIVAGAEARAGFGRNRDPGGGGDRSE